MNRSIIYYILGQVLKIEALLMLLPCLVAIIYWETTGVYFVITLALCGLVGIALTFRKPDSFVFYLKEGCIATALSWLVLSIFGCIPFVISSEIPSFTDALFETISGFTTTGASILNDIESLSHCMLFWRSFTHWIGGMGVLVFLLAILPLTGGSNMNLMRAESPGPSVGKLVPKVRYTARILYYIYFGLTVTEAFLLLIGGMDLFEALTISFGTTGTGGFGILNDSAVSYSPYHQWVITIFMILSGVNFNAYYFLLFKNWKLAFKMEEVKYYLILIGVSTIFIFGQLMHFSIYTNGFEAFRHSAFQVASIITSTGFSTADFDIWPQTSRMLLVMLMFVGACAGSTGGGIKVSRFVITIKTIGRELTSYIHPKSVKKINMDEKPVDADTIRSIGVYFITFTMVYVISLFLISLEGKDLVTDFTAVVATLNNIGPGLSLVGPTQNFSCFTAFSKYVLMFDMLAGRLELFPLLLVFHPAILKSFFTRSKK